MGIFNTADNATYQFLSDESTNTLAASYVGGSNGKAYSGLTLSDDSWHMITGIFLSDTNRCVAVDGIVKTCNTTNINFGTFDNLTFGFQNRATPGSYLTGLLDEAGIWGRALTEAEITELYNGGAGLPYESFNTSIDANFTYTIDKVNLEIDFNDTSTSTFTTIDDWNWIINDVLESTDQNFSYATNPFTDINACLVIDNNDDTLTDTQCYQFNTGNFYGTFIFNVFDENSSLDLNGTTYTISPSINGDSGSTLTDNTLDLNLQGITTATYTFTFTKTNYSTRTWLFDLNQYTDLNIDFALLPETLGSNIEFKFFETDRTTLLSNADILVTHNTKNYVIAKTTTDAYGQATFFLNLNDSNYNFYIISQTSEIFDYNSISLTINRPKDEATGATINTNWNYVLSGLAASSDTNLSTNTTTLALYANTLNTYIVTVGSNSTDPTYENRIYEYIFKGNDNETLQPYLLQSTDASTIKLITEQVNQLVESRYPGVEVKIYKQLTDTGRSLIEQVVTDAKGEAFVTLKAGDTYEFEAYKDGSVISFNENTINFIKIAGATIVFTISANDINAAQVTQYGFGINWVPIGQALQQKTVGTQVFSQILTNLGGQSITAYSYITQDNNTISTSSYTGSGNKTFTHTINWNELSKGTVTATIRITTDTNTYDYNYNYTISGFAGGFYDPIQGLKTGIRSDLSCSETGICHPLLFLAIIISIGIAGFGFIGIGLGTQSTSILFIAPMVLFTYITWVPIELTIGIVVVGFAFMLNDRRGS